MNENHIITTAFSNPESEQLYKSQWSDEPQIFAQYENGEQCGGCSFFAPFNFDWGLCCQSDSRHHLETVFEHFTCPLYADEGWEAHSFLRVADRVAMRALEAKSKNLSDDLKQRAAAKGIYPNDSDQKEE